MQECKYQIKINVACENPVLETTINASFIHVFKKVVCFERLLKQILTCSTNTGQIFKISYLQMLELFVFIFQVLAPIFKCLKKSRFYMTSCCLIQFVLIRQWTEKQVHSTVSGWNIRAIPEQMLH